MAGQLTTRWLLVGAVLLAQAGLAERCLSCERGCCADSAAGCCRSARRDGDRPDGSGACPACARLAGLDHADACVPVPSSDAPPCRCVLESRDDAPAVPERRDDRPLQAVGVVPWSGLAAAQVEADPVAAPSDARFRPPERPLRVRYGVWRN